VVFRKKCDSYATRGKITATISITVQDCIADAHSLPEITEKMVVRDFFGTLRCNIREPLFVKMP
jgi:hypothetical protein